VYCLHMKHASVAALLCAPLALVGLVACNSDSTPGGDPDAACTGAACGGIDSPIAIDAPDNTGWTPLISRSWSIPAGATDTYRCTRIQVPNDMWISGFRALSPMGTHHSVLTISQTATPLGDYDCSAGALDYQMLYAAGVNTDDLAFPAGVAMHLTAGSYINLNLHLFNVTDDPITGTSGVLVKVVDHAQVQNEADMVFSGTLQLNIPSTNTPITQTGGCTNSQPWHIFALWPHMHQTAVHQKWTYTPTGGAEITMLDDDYMFTEQKNYPIAETVIPQGSTIRTTCTYVNNTGHTLMFGESSNDEMCFTGMYRYPAGGSLFSCALGGGGG
jgi:hypothetical protein